MEGLSASLDVFSEAGEAEVSDLRIPACDVNGPLGLEVRFVVPDRS